MALGDIIHMPDQANQFNITIGAGGTALDDAWEYEIIYDPNEWYITYAAIFISATQSYLPAVSNVSLINSLYIKDVNTQVLLGLQRGEISWVNSDYNTPKSLFLQGVVNANNNPKGSIYITDIFTIPVVAVTPQNANITHTVQADFYQLVANPKASPIWGKKTRTGGATGGDWIWLALLGIGVVALLFGSGYALTGLGSFVKDVRAPKQSGGLI